MRDKRPRTLQAGVTQRTFAAPRCVIAPRARSSWPNVAGLAYNLRQRKLVSCSALLVGAIVALLTLLLNEKCGRERNNQVLDPRFNVELQHGSALYLNVVDELADPDQVISSPVNKLTLDYNPVDLARELA